MQFDPGYNALCLYSPLNTLSVAESAKNITF